MARRGQERRERRRSERRVRRFTPQMWLIVAGVGLGLVALMGLLVVSSGVGDVGQAGRFPQIGEHRHANYFISICGESEPAFPVSEGDVHTHGSGSIHIHPANALDAGRNATLSRFLDGAGARLTNESIELPSGVSFTNGDLCPDGRTGQMFLRVNGVTVAGVADYVPRVEDSVELGFEAQ